MTGALAKTTPTQRQLLRLMEASPRGYVTKTAEGSKDMMALGMMGLAHDIYEMPSGGFMGVISAAGRDELELYTPEA